MLPALRNPLFASVMSGRRFEQIKACLHFFDQEKFKDYAGEPQPGQVGYHRLLKVRLVVDTGMEASRRLRCLRGGC